MSALVPDGSDSAFTLRPKRTRPTGPLPAYRGDRGDGSTAALDMHDLARMTQPPAVTWCQRREPIASLEPVRKLVSTARRGPPQSARLPGPWLSVEMRACGDLRALRGAALPRFGGRGERVGCGGGCCVRWGQPVVVGGAPPCAVEESCDGCGLGARGPEDRPLSQDLWVDDLPGDDAWFGLGAVEANEAEPRPTSRAPRRRASIALTGGLGKALTWGWKPARSHVFMMRS
jgi:hypothetical protein